MRGRVGPTVWSPQTLVGLEAETPHTLARSWVPIPTELLQTNSATDFCTTYFNTTESVWNLTPSRLADSVQLSAQHTASIRKAASLPWRWQQCILTKHLLSTDSATSQKASAYAKWDALFRSFSVWPGKQHKWLLTGGVMLQNQGLHCSRYDAICNHVVYGAAPVVSLMNHLGQLGG